jgi:hypothetical protein
MSKATNIALFAVGLSLSSSLLGNDGRDRSKGALANAFVFFPEPISKSSGYRLLDRDGPGGADGTEMFRWVRPIGSTVVRLAAYETWRQMGEVEFPMAIFDLTSENGDTPVQFEPGKAPRGRHPGGSHDGGLNMDLGYYLTSTKGKVFSPDLAACTEHLKTPKEISKAPPEDASQCLGAADKLSVKHQSFFLLELAKINREYFDSDLIEEIGIDWEARKLVNKQIEQWAKTNAYGATNDIARQLDNVFTSDAWDGWSTSHHHHIHVRMRDINMLGRFRVAFNRLLAKEKINDLQVLKENSPSSAQFLWTRLYSFNLSSSIEAEVLGGDPLNQVRFSSDALEAQTADVSRAPRISATWDLNDEMRSEATGAEVKAEISAAGKIIKSLSKTQRLPARPSYLSIAVDPNQIRGIVENDLLGKTLLIKLSFPQPYLNYITDASYTVSYGDNHEPQKVFATRPDFFISIPIDKTKTISHINANLKLSGRMSLSIPVYSATLWQMPDPKAKP